MKKKKNKSQKKITISKGLFMETMDIIQKQMVFDSECCDAFAKLLPNDFVSGYDNGKLHTQILKILKIATKDVETKWIDYFIWDMDFGKDWKENSITENGKCIPLKDVNDLWTLLCDNCKNK